MRVMGTVLDITDRKRNEERQRLLMAELDHRVKNILGNVSAVARLSSHRAQSVEAFVESLDGRIQAISRAHGGAFGVIRPASTMVVVRALLDPRWKVEIEAEAIIG